MTQQPPLPDPTYEQPQWVPGALTVVQPLSYWQRVGRVFLAITRIIRWQVGAALVFAVIGFIRNNDLFRPGLATTVVIFAGTAVVALGIALIGAYEFREMPANAPSPRDPPDTGCHSCLVVALGLLWLVPLYMAFAFAFS